MSLSDLKNVHRIEEQCFDTPWSLKSLQYEVNNTDTVLQVAELDGRIIGYACLRTMLDITHVMKIAVQPCYRCQGAGSLLFRDALNALKLSRPDAERITLEVRESNATATGLYNKFGFKITGKRKEYFKKPEEDGIIMELRICKPDF
jgi:ribosomal-protein-alanine N-acetyltransferase